MKEVQFVHRNKAKWERFEKLLKSRHIRGRPDEMAQLYIELTDDLAYVRTNYPRSQLMGYLNSLAARAHNRLYKNRPQEKGVLKRFFLYGYPLLFRNGMRYFYVSLAIFAFSIVLGIFSAANDDTFVRLILGDRYVNMTLQNIENGEPLAVYKSARHLDMFLGITINNFYVALLAFVFGIFTPLGPAWVLFNNGMMVGVFHYLFYEQGLLYEALRTIWIHGTFELFAIVVAGMAGTLAGSRLVFPGTYPRWYAFRQGFRHGAKIVAGILPFFFVAAFFEGFITRYTQMPDWSRWAIILGSAAVIAWYFFIYPARLQKHKLHE